MSPQAHIERLASLRRLAWLDAIGFTVFERLTQGQFLVGCLTRIGTHGLLLATALSLVHLTTALQPLAAPIVQNAPDRKRLFLRTAVLSRLAWLAIAAAVLLLPPGQATVSVLVLLAISQGLSAYSQNAWLTWMSDLLPQEERCQFFSRRNSLISLTTILTLIVGGVFVDRTGEAASYPILFIVGAAFGLASAAALARAPHADPAPRLEATGLADYYLLPWRDSAFRKLLVFKASWSFVVGLSGPLWVPHMLQVLGMTHSQVSSYNITGLFAGLLFSGPAALLARRFGDRRTLLLAAAGITLNPLWWCLPTREFLLPAWFEGFWSGSLWTAFNLVALHMAIGLAPVRARPIYLGLFFASEGVAFFASGLIGGLLSELTTGFSWHGWGLHLGPYHPVMLLSAAGRAASLLLFVGLTARSPRARRPEPSATRESLRPALAR